MEIIGGIVLVFGSVVWNAYVGSILWGWIVVPTLGLPALTVLETFAVGLVARVLSSAQGARDDKRRGEDSNARTLRLVLTAFLSPLIALVFGWIVRGFL